MEFQDWLHSLYLYTCIYVWTQEYIKPLVTQIFIILDSDAQKNKETYQISL
jgi:hypothetical protein